MRYTLIDRIVDLEPGVRITAIKNVSLAEEYLQDHFPRFPVFPGVLMLEAMTQAGAWLIRASEDFSHSIVVLKEARNVKYADFVAPGQVLTVSAEITKQDDHETTLSASGVVEGTKSVGGRLVLERFNLADRNRDDVASDQYIRREMRRLFAILMGGDRVATARAIGGNDRPLSEV